MRARHCREATSEGMIFGSAHSFGLEVFVLDVGLVFDGCSDVCSLDVLGAHGTNARQRLHQPMRIHAAPGPLEPLGHDWPCHQDGCPKGESLRTHDALSAK